MFFEEITLSKKSWHWRWQKFILGDLGWDNYPANFCPYFWSIIGVIILTPIVLIGRAIIFPFTKIISIGSEFIYSLQQRRARKRNESLMAILAYINWHCKSHSYQLYSDAAEKLTAQNCEHALNAAKFIEEHHYSIGILIARNIRKLLKCDIPDEQTLEKLIIKHWSSIETAVLNIEYNIQQSEEWQEKKTYALQMLSEKLEYLNDKVFKKPFVMTLFKITSTILPIIGICIAVVAIGAVGYIIYVNWIFVFSCILGVAAVISILGLLWVTFNLIIIWIGCIRPIKLKLPHIKGRPTFINVALFKLGKLRKRIVFGLKIFITMFFAWKKENCPGIIWEDE